MMQDRFWIADYSLKRAKKRIAEQKANQLIPEIEKAAKNQESYRKIKGFTNYSSEVGDTRPLSFCRFSPDSKMVAISSW
jgi:U4/U6 small nuclear ribonucleoprotein PRP4